MIMIMIMITTDLPPLFIQRELGKQGKFRVNGHKFETKRFQNRFIIRKGKGHNRRGGNCIKFGTLIGSNELYAIERCPSDEVDRKRVISNRALLAP